MSNMQPEKNSNELFSLNKHTITIDRKKLMALIPNDCFQPNTYISLFYFLFDTLALILLYTSATLFNSWFFWPLFWILAGTFFWSYFVIAHDCGHHSFSKHKWINHLIGHICNTIMLVPFYGWQISHRKHHATTNNYATEEAHRPFTKTQMKKFGKIIKFIRLRIFLLLGPIYMLFLRHDHYSSHYLPNKYLFIKAQYLKVLISTISCLLFVGLLAYLTYLNGFLFIIKYYLGPYSVSFIWFTLVTYLQHTDKKVPWYCATSWTPLIGALSSIDRNYGKILNFIQHQTGNYHVIHHLFPKIPHYKLKRATDAIYPYIKNYYFKDNRFFLISFLDSFRNCHYIDENKNISPYVRSESNVGCAKKRSFVHTIKKTIF